MARESSLQEVLVASFEHQTSNLYTAIPGIILTVRNNLNEMSVDVQPSLNDLSRDGTITERPPALNVPVIFPASSTSAFTFPLNVGDTVLLVFSMRGLSNWKRGTGRPAAPGDLRRFHASDCIAIPGLFPFSNSINNPAKRIWSHNTNDTVVVGNIGTGNETEVRISQSGGVQINTYQNVEVNCATATVTATDEINLNTPQMTVNAEQTAWVGDIQHAGVLENVGTIKSNNVTVSGHKHNGGSPPDVGT